MCLLLETTYRFGACFFLLCKRVEGRMSLHRVSWTMVVLLQSQAPTDSSTVGLVWEWTEGFWASWTLFGGCVCVCVCVQDWANLLGHAGLWKKEEGSRSAPPALCLQKGWPASQHFEAGTHPLGLINPCSCLLQRERGWLGQAILLLDWSSGHLIFYNSDENQLNVLKATCFLSGIFKWCGSYFGCSKRVGTS